MVIFLGILIVLVIGAIVAILFLKNKQQALDDEPTISPIAHSGRQNERFAPSTDDDDDDTPSVDSTLNGITKLIDNGRYDEASSELKRLFVANPKSSPVILKMLQVYALTGNEHSFNQYYAKLEALGDDASVEEAQAMRLVFDSASNDDLEADPFADFNNPVSQAPAPSFDDIGSNTPFASADKNEPDDFSAFNFDTDEPTPASAPVAKDDDLDFGLDDFGASTDQGLDGGLAFNTNNSDNAFDGLAFDTPAPSPAPKTDDDFGLGMDFNAPTPAPIAQTDDGLAFDGFDFDTPTPSPTPAPQAQTDDFDFNLGNDLAFSTPSPAPVPAVEDSFDFDLGVSEPKANDDFNFDALNNNQADEFNFDIPVPAPTPAPEPASFDDFAFDTPSPAPVSAPANNLDADEFNFDTFNGTTTQETTSGQDDFDFDSFVASPSVETKADDDFTNEFDLGNDLAFNTPSPAPAPTVEDSFDFDLGGSTANNDFDLGVSEPKANDDFNFDALNNNQADEFNFDIPAPAPTPALEPASFDDFAFDTPSPAPVSAPEQDTSFGLGDFTISTPSPAPTQTDFGGADDFDLFTTPTPAPEAVAPAIGEITAPASAFDPSFELDSFGLDNISAPAPTPVISPSLDTASSIARQSLDTGSMFNDNFVLPSMQTASTGDSGLDFVNHLDNAQITLDLAKNYLSLGEHGSARRLLTEVLETGTADQRHQAHTLLSRLA